MRNIFLAIDLHITNFSELLSMKPVLEKPVG